MLENAAEVKHERADENTGDDKIGVGSEVHARALHERVAQHAAAVARDQTAHHRADDIELAVAREQRAGEHAGDDAEIVDAPRHREHWRVGEDPLQPSFHVNPFSAAGGECGQHVTDDARIQTQTSADRSAGARRPRPCEPR